MTTIKRSPILILSIISIFTCSMLAGCTYSRTIPRISRSGEYPKIVDAIDSIVITGLYDTDDVLAEWSLFEPDITVNHTFTSAEAIRLLINWSDHGGSLDLHRNDYFTFIIPGVFNHSIIPNENNKEITDSNGEVAATYSIYTNARGLKEVKVTFTDYVETHTDISGDLWLNLYLGSVELTETNSLEFIINGELTANADVTINPQETVDLDHPSSVKYGYSSPAKIVNGHYIFEWNVLLNTGENSSTGFNTLENYSFEDIIPSDSPHVFITSEIAGELGIPSSYQSATIREYTGSDNEPPTQRYQTFLKRYYYVGGDPWVNYLSSHTLANGVSSGGIDGKSGLNISNVTTTSKSFSARLGTLTRPTLIRYYTVATIKISEGSLGDSEAVKYFENTFVGSNRENLTASLTKYYFASGGSANGILGDYAFTFTKVDENNTALPGALFSLYTNENLTDGANRFAISDNNGFVVFDNLAEGIYYFQETTAPEGYIQDHSIYKVELNSQGYTIYYGNSFENKLSDYGNRIVNRLGSKSIEPVYVTLTGTKVLMGRALEDGMFMFALKSADGSADYIVKNDVYGNIHFNSLEYTTEGSYLYTITEVLGNEPGMNYSNMVYSVIVTVEKTSDETLTATVEYPDGDILFENTYELVEEPPEVEPPVTEPPETEPPVTEPPVAESPEVEPPETVTPEVLPPEAVTPEAEAPETVTPEVDAPETVTPEMEAPATETPEAEITENPKTGDYSNIGICITILVISIILWTTLEYKKNRRAK